MSELLPVVRGPRERGGPIELWAKSCVSCGMDVFTTYPNCVASCQSCDADVNTITARKREEDARA